MNVLAQAPGYGSVSAQEAIFILLGLIAIGSAVLVVTTKNVVHAAFFLVLTLASVAAGYLLLAAEFVAWVQVLIYIGAVVVLLLFGIMLTKAPIKGDPSELDGNNKWAALLVALASAGTLVTLVVDAFRHQFIDLKHVANTPETAGSAERIGDSLFQSYVLPFEVVSLLLLAALVGSIVLSRRDEGGQ